MIAGPSILSPASSFSSLVEGCRLALGHAVDIECDVALEHLGPRDIAASGSNFADPELRDAADPDRADVDDLDLGVEALPVLGFVRAVEALFQLVDPGIVDRTRRGVETNLVALACVAAVGEAPHDAPILGHIVGLEAPNRLRDKLVEAGIQFRLVKPLDLVTLGRDELVL